MRIAVRSIFLSSILLTTALIIQGTSLRPARQDGELLAETISKVRTVADAVLRDGTFEFVDENTGVKYTSTSAAHAGSQLKLMSSYNDWRYWNGVINISLVNLSNVLGDSTYKTFAAKNIAFAFDNYEYFRNSYVRGDRWSYPFYQRFTMVELDDYGAMTASTIEAYEMHPGARYRNYIDSAAGFLAKRQDRLHDGTLVRPYPRKWTVWADDLYMSVSFLSRMGEFTRDTIYFQDAARQVINFQQYLYSPAEGLMYHCWFSDSAKNGVAFWGRANGWMILAQIDLLDRLPESFSLRDTLLSIFRQDVAGISSHEDADGMWHQLLDRRDSYEETSCSAMFTYAIARGVDEGFLSGNYADVAKRGWTGIMKKILPNGEIAGVCEGTGVGDSLAFYYARPTPLNDPHGIGAVLLAGAEMTRLLK